MILQFYNGEIKELHTRRFVTEYIEGKGLILNSDGHMDYYFDDIYKFDEGEYKTVASGEYGGQWVNQKPDYKFKWNGVEMSSQEYLQNLFSCYDTEKSLYPLKNKHSYYSSTSVTSDGFEIFCKTDLLTFLKG